MKNKISNDVKVTKEIKNAAAVAGPKIKIPVGDSKTVNAAREVSQKFNFEKASKKEQPFTSQEFEEINAYIENLTKEELAKENIKRLVDYILAIPYEVVNTPAALSNINIWCNEVNLLLENTLKISLTDIEMFWESVWKKYLRINNIEEGPRSVKN